MSSPGGLGNEQRPRNGVVIAALTFNRPEGLAALLDAWTHLSTPTGAKFLIVDNSPDANARERVDAAATTRAIDLHYTHEPTPGISAARNRALREAVALGARWLAFIDDDEIPSELWLVRLLETAERSGAQAVVGRVAAQLPPGTAAWIGRAGFFDIVGPGEGAGVEEGATCNALIDLTFVERTKLRFDPAFGLSGAEDTWFFRRLRALGGRIVFSEAALVHDIIPPARARLGWLMQRWRRTGNTDARIRMLEGVSRLQIGLSGVARCVLGALIALVGLAPALVGRFDLCARGIRVSARGAGYLAAAAGRKLIEYRVNDAGSGAGSGPKSRTSAAA